MQYRGLDSMKLPMLEMKSGIAESMSMEAQSETGAQKAGFGGAGAVVLGAATKLVAVAVMLGVVDGAADDEASWGAGAASAAWRKKGRRVRRMVRVYILKGLDCCGRSE